jgi:hypothetical protein
VLKNELIRELSEMRIPHDSYSIDFEKNESICLMNDGMLWVVFYSERGQKTEPKYFVDEEEACDNFFSRLKVMLEI